MHWYFFSFAKMSTICAGLDVFGDLRTDGSARCDQKIDFHIFSNFLLNCVLNFIFFQIFFFTVCWILVSYFAMSWWHHQMETFSALLAICAGNSPASSEFPTQRPVTRSFDVFFDLCLNKRLRKQSWGWWFEMLSCPLWRHCNGEGDTLVYY